MNNKYLLVFLFAAYCGLSLPGNAQQHTDTAAVKNLEEVVITGQYTPQSVKNSVYQVRTISKDKIEKLGATRLQDVLMNELNIRFSQDLATGGSDITMLGLKGQNVKILVDGLPLVGRQGATNEININQVDVNSIERIEIVEGPMSVVYGADALAGVINIITKKEGKEKFAVQARLHEETAGKEYGIKQGVHNQYAGFTTQFKNWEAGGGFGHNYFGGWRDTATGRELTWHKKDQLMANGFIGWRARGFHIRYRVDGLDEVITNPGNFLYYQSSSGDTLAQDQEYLTRRVMQQLQASYTAGNHLSFRVQSSYTDYSRQVFSTTVSRKTGDVHLNTAPGSQSVVDFTGFTFRASAVYKVSDVYSFQPGVDINTESGQGERLKEGMSGIEDYAFFLTSEITPSGKINLRPGLRFIKNSVYDAPPVIPSLNVKFVLSDQLRLRMAYAKGFRAPSIRELYFNFFDANHQIVGNTDLKAETSNTLTASLSWNKNHKGGMTSTLIVSGFYNHIKNLIDYAVSASDPNVFELTNVSDSKTAGAALSGTAKHKQWNISFGGSVTGFYNELSETAGNLPQLQWSAELNTGIGYTIAKAGLDINLFYKFTGKRPQYVIRDQDLALSEQEGYHWADLTINKKLFNLLMLQAGVRNLFDIERIGSTVTSNGVHASGGTRNIAVGRSFFAGLLFNWNKK